MNMRKHARWGIALALAAAGLLLGIYLLRGVLIYPPLEKAVADFVRSEADLQLEWGGIRGPVFGSLEVADLRINSLESADTLIDVHIASLRLRYRLIDLLHGIDVFVKGMTIDVDQPSARIDWSRAAPTPDGEDTPGSLGGLPQALPRVNLHDGRLELLGDGYHGRFDGLSLVSTIDSSQKANGFALTVENWSWHLPPLRDGQVRAAAHVILEPSGLIRIDGLALEDRVVFDKGTVALAELPRAVSFSAFREQPDNRLTVEGRVDEELRLQVSGANLDPALIERIMEAPELDLAGNIDLEADIRLPLAEPAGLEGDLRIHSGTGRWRTLHWEEGDLRASAGDGMLTIHEVHLTGGDNSCRLQDLSLPAAPVFEGQIDALLAGLGGDFAINLQNLPALAAAFDPETAVQEKSIPPHQLELAGTIRRGVLTVDKGLLAAGGGLVHVKRLEADLKDVAALGADAALEADADIQWPDLRDLAALFPIPELEGRLQGHIHLAGSRHLPRGQLGLQGEGLQLAGVRLGNLELACRSDGEWLTIDTGRLRNREDRAVLSGSVAHATGRLADTRFKLQVRDMEPYAKPFLAADQQVAGGLSVEAAVTGTLQEPVLAADYALSRTTLGSFSVATARGRLQATKASIAITRLEANSEMGSIDLAADIAFNSAGTPVQIDLARLSYQNSDTAMDLTAPARISRLKDGGWRFKSLELAGTAGRISVRGAIGGTGAGDFFVDLTGVRSGSWLAEMDGPVQDFDGLDARLHFTGTPSAPRAEITGHMPHLRLRKWPHPLEGRFDLAVDDAGITVRRWMWSDDAGQLFSTAGHIPMVYDAGWRKMPGPLQLTGDFSMQDVAFLQSVIPDSPVSGGSLQARLDLAGTAAAPTGTLACTVKDLVLAPSPEGSPQGPFEGRAMLNLRPEGVDLEELRLDAAFMSLRGRGRWRAADGSTPWFARLDQLSEGHLSASADIDIPDLGWLGEMLPGVRRVGGRVEGTLHVEGPLSKPMLEADLSLKDASLRLEGDAPGLESLEADFRADGERVMIRSLRGEIGGAPFQVAGELRRSADKGWMPDLHLTGKNLLLYRTADIRVRADTDVRLTGPLEKMTLSGEVGLTNGRATRYIDLLGFLKKAPPSAGVPSEVLFSLPDPPLKDLIFDVRITSRTPFELRNNVIRGSLRPDLHLGGTGELPLLTGEVYVDPTRLRMPAGIMSIESGVIRFLPSRANRPVMDLRGEGRVFDYEITALIEGPVEEPQITLSSSPPLPSDQLMLMLLTGSPPREENQTGAEGVPMNLAVYVGQD